MPVFRIDERLIFPPVHLAEDGLLAVGGDLRPERLMLAYSKGIFPWYGENLPILWHAPDQRMIMTTSDLAIQRSLKKNIRKRPYELRVDTAFEEVLRGCASAPRPGQNGTWLIPEMMQAYMELHSLGLAHSFEAWKDGELMGGCYGVSLGAAFFGESMFARGPDASKIAYATCVNQLHAWGIGLIDCQVHTEHLERFGGYEIPRLDYMELLHVALDQPTRRGKWHLELDFDDFTARGGVLPGSGKHPRKHDDDE